MAPRVLVVDDNAMNVELVSYVLTHDDFVVKACTDANAALADLDSFKPELILMDVQLPGLSGLELTRQLKEDARHRHIVIVAFTAYAMKGDEAKFRAAGCDGYISKPIKVATFAATLRKILEEQGSAS